MSQADVVAAAVDRHDPGEDLEDKVSGEVHCRVADLDDFDRRAGAPVVDRLLSDRELGAGGAEAVGNGVVDFAAGGLPCEVVECAREVGGGSHSWT